MLYVGETSIHTKQRGQIRRCDWCGQVINTGEQYAKWLCFDCGSRQTVYAHKECNEAWMELSRAEGGIVEITRGSQERSSIEQTDNKVPFALPWRMVERRYVFAIVDANGDDVTHFSKNLLSYRSIISTDTIKEIDKPVMECAEMIVRCCNNHRGTDKYSADEALAIADGLMEGDAMAAAKTLAAEARFYFKEYEALRKIMASMGTRATIKGD